MFYGQRQLLNELENLLHQGAGGERFNILISGPSGYGKTHLALLCLKYLGLDRAKIYYPDKERGIIFEPKATIHFVDEVHTLPNPESLFRAMDSKQYIFILATNFPELLPEAMRNRCIPFSLLPYSMEELVEMASNLLKEFPQGTAEIVAERSRGVPRTLKLICDRLGYICRSRGIPSTVEETVEIIEGTLRIKPGGLTPEDEIYLTVIQHLGKASLQTLVGVTHLSKDTIIYHVEPFLLHKGLIKITSKGREYVVPITNNANS